MAVQRGIEKTFFFFLITHTKKPSMPSSLKILETQLNKPLSQSTQADSQDGEIAHSTHPSQAL